jgi:hypothetical protein
MMLNHKKTETLHFAQFHSVFIRTTTTTAHQHNMTATFTLRQESLCKVILNMRIWRGIR